MFFLLSLRGRVHVEKTDRFLQGTADVRYMYLVAPIIQISARPLMEHERHRVAATGGWSVAQVHVHVVGPTEHDINAQCQE